MFLFLRWVVLRIKEHSFVAKFLSTFYGRFAQHYKPRVVERGDNYGYLAFLIPCLVRTSGEAREKHREQTYQNDLTQTLFH